MSVRLELPDPLGFILGGETRCEGEVLEVRSPYDGRLVGRTFRPSPEALGEAVNRCGSAAKVMGRLAAFERSAILERLAAAVRERRDDFVRLLALEAGKPVKAGRVEVERCLTNLQEAAAEALRIEGELLPLDHFPGGRGRWGIVRRFPLGSILAVTPFNFPLNLVVHKLAPAVASGNAVVQKPASQTPLTSLLLGRLFYEAGLPEGALSVLPCSGPAAEELVKDERFQLLTFTGSAAVGWRLKGIAGKKRVTLELGGNAAAIVHDDADLEWAAARCVSGGFAYAGQSCISVQRIFVQRRVWDPFVRILVDGVEKLKMGDPLDEATDVGPLISEGDAVRVESWIAEALEGGAECLTGGKRRGVFVEPTVLTRTRPEMKVNCEEVFGPLVTVEPYSDFEEALDRANDSRYGLQAGVFTRNLDLAWKAFETLEVGGVTVNEAPTFRADHMPYGGTKDSGIGREGARYAIEEMTERRILIVVPREG